MTEDKELDGTLGPIERAVADAVGSYLESDDCKKALEEGVGKLVRDAISDAFAWNGSVRKKLGKRIEDIAIPAIERWGGATSEGNVKLDALVTQALEESIEGERVTIFKRLSGFLSPKRRHTIKASELLQAYGKWVAEDIDCYDRGVKEEAEEYDDVETHIFFDDSGEGAQKNMWSSTSVQRAVLIFDVNEESDDVASKFFRSIPISQWAHDREDGVWSLDYKMPTDITSVLHASSFDVFLARLASDRTKVEIDFDALRGDVLDVTPKDTPEWQLQ